MKLRPSAEKRGEVVDWYTQTFGECPHGGIKPYCPQCVGDELETSSRERTQERTTAKLAETVSRQSRVIADQDAYIDVLKRRLARR
jgi:rRNA-processing protein FCF1